MPHTYAKSQSQRPTQIKLCIAWNTEKVHCNERQFQHISMQPLAGGSCRRALVCLIFTAPIGVQHRQPQVQARSSHTCLLCWTGAASQQLAQNPCSTFPESADRPWYGSQHWACLLPSCFAPWFSPVLPGRTLAPPLRCSQVLTCTPKHTLTAPWRDGIPLPDSLLPGPRTALCHLVFHQTSPLSSWRAESAGTVTPAHWSHLPADGEKADWRMELSPPGWGLLMGGGKPRAAFCERQPPRTELPSAVAAARKMARTLHDGVLPGGDVTRESRHHAMSS